MYHNQITDEINERVESMTRIQVLVADGETLYRESICAILGDQPDIKIAGRARSTKELINKAHKRRPDVVVMELAMDKGNGEDTLREMRNGNRDTKVLFVSQYEDEKHILSGLSSGCDGYIPKRATGSELISAIRVVHQGGYFLYPSVARVVIDECVKRFRELRETA